MSNLAGEDESATVDDFELSPESAHGEGRAGPATFTAFGASTLPSGARPFAFTFGQGAGAQSGLALPKVVLGAPAGENTAAPTTGENGTTTTGDNTATTTTTSNVAPTDDGLGLRTAGYVAGGVGLVGLTLFAIAGLGAKSAYDKLESDCGSAPCTDEAHRSDIEEGRMMQTAANIGLATGIVGIGLGATLLVLGKQSPSDKRAPSASLSTGGAMITYGGSF